MTGADEVLVTSGGTEALTAAIMGLVGPGDEVVLIEPAYDSYRPIAEAVGARGQDRDPGAARIGG